MKKIKTLIVAACQNELKHLCKMGRKFFVIKNNTAFLSAGIGPVAAAFGLTHFLEDYRPELIISIGTAGGINPEFRIGETVLARSATIASGNGDVYAVGVSRTIHYITKGAGGGAPSLAGAVTAPLPRVNVYCPQEISCDEARRRILLKHGHDIENLEAYALAFAAKKFKTPFISFLGITNTIGPNSHKEWKKNEEKVMENLSRVVKDLFL